MDLAEFSERLVSLLFDARLTPEQFARAIGIGRTSAYELLAGHRTPSLATLVAIADYFHCYVDYLVGLEVTDYRLERPRPCPPFRERIPALCEHFGITRYRLIARTQIARTSMNNWARGATVPSVDNLLKMAEALDCSVDFLLGRD